jgi:hypothetical protein
MNEEPIKRGDGAIERLLAAGDLAKLSADQRMTYYLTICESLGLNPQTRPFEFITLNGKLTLYARKDATDQLRKIHGVSIEKPDIRFEDDWIIVSVTARDSTGRTDADVGVVSRKDMRGDFGNCLMKAITKAKRRVTLSIVGLGMLDETEVETIPDARPEPAPHRAALPEPIVEQPSADATEITDQMVLEAIHKAKRTWDEAAPFLTHMLALDIKQVSDLRQEHRQRLLTFLENGGGRKIPKKQKEEATT